VINSVLKEWHSQSDAQKEEARFLSLTFSLILTI
jgi:hypothetical protein